MKFKLYRFSKWNDSSPASYNPWEKKCKFCFWIHFGRFTVWNKVSDGTTECWQYLTMTFTLELP